MIDQPSAVLRQLVMPVYLPVIAATFGMAMLVPVLPLYLTSEGFSLGTTSVILAAAGLGASIGGLPAGSLVARLSERSVLFGALWVTAASIAVLGVTTAVGALVGFRLSFGAANVAVRLSRQTFITRRVVPGVRGRAMALFGGSFRLALLFGPLLGGALVDLVGFRSTFLVAGAFAAAGILPAKLGGEGRLGLLPDASTVQQQTGLLKSLSAHKQRLLTAGFAPMLVMTVREGRFVVLPLIGDGLGLSATGVGALVTVSTAADVLLFPVAGWLMDRFGRLYAMVPAFGLVTMGLVILGLANSTSTVVLAGVVMGVGNGMSAGTLLTLGSDLAPLDSPGPFLAGMATLQDSGRFLGPMLVGAIGAWIDLSASAFALAIVMLVAIAWLIAVVGETSDEQT
ncbi:MAG: MFS transporter [Acidimicrobiales bacterium]